MRATISTISFTLARGMARSYSSSILKRFFPWMITVVFPSSILSTFKFLLPYRMQLFKARIFITWLCCATSTLFSALASFIVYRLISSCNYWYHYARKKHHISKWRNDSSKPLPDSSPLHLQVIEEEFCICIKSYSDKLSKNDILICS